jgi:hypothetical protein
MSDTDDFIKAAAKKLHDAIDQNTVIPAEGKGALHGLAGKAEGVVHAVADAGRDVAETTAIVALEASDQLQQRYKRRTRIVNAVGASVIVVLLAALVSARRRH